jgi:hypothetical protein
MSQQLMLALTKKSKSIIAFNKLHFPSSVIATGLLFATLTACTIPPIQPTVSITDLSTRPGDKTLLEGVNAYEEAQYYKAEKLLNEALGLGLTVKKDGALAYKYLAFIYCTSNRINDCRNAFTAARAADPTFVLSKKEIGHPQWGPIYKQMVGE